MIQSIDDPELAALVGSTFAFEVLPEGTDRALVMKALKNALKQLIHNLTTLKTIDKTFR